MARRNVLVTGVAVVLAVAAALPLVGFAVAAPFRSVQAAIAGEQARGAALRRALAAFSGVEDRWRVLVGHTLSGRPGAAQESFRDELHRLLSRHGLGATAKITPGSPSQDLKTQQWTVPVTVNTAGTLEQIVRFMHDFYRGQNFTRLEKVSVAADSGVVQRSDSSTARDARRGTLPASISSREPELRLSLTADTLVLPAGRGQPEVTGPVLAPGEESSRVGPDVERYATIYTHSIFQPWSPPVVVGQELAGRGRAAGGATPQDDPAASRLVRFCAQIDYQPVTYVDDTRPTTERRLTPQHLGDPLDGEPGRIVLIHPEGVVVRVVSPVDGSRKDFFYRLGVTFRERAELTPENYPEIYRAVREQEQQR